MPKYYTSTYPIVCKYFDCIFFRPRLSTGAANLLYLAHHCSHIPATNWMQHNIQVFAYRCCMLQLLYSVKATA